MNIDMIVRTTIIQHYDLDVAGYRSVADDAVSVVVHAFPTTTANTVAGTGILARPGAYLLVGDGVYVGESCDVGRRLLEHAADTSKAFATEVFAITGDQRLDKAAAVHLQARLIAAAASAGLMRLRNEISGAKADLPPYRVPPLDRLLSDVLPLLFDAGCRVFAALRPNPEYGSDGSMIETIRTAAGPSDETGDDETGRMEIGVTVTPIGVQESELCYSDIWARGYEHLGRFIVAAGSELRVHENFSIGDRIRERRELLLADATSAIQGREDRVRLTVAVAFPSRATAAKVLTGAHIGTDRRRPLRRMPFVISG